MFEFTPEERRGAVLLLALLALGVGWDLWRADHPVPIPAEGSRASASLERPASNSPASAAPADAPVDVNRADESELDRLPGIGPVLARRIVEHRRRNGPFRRVEELRAVRGIGPTLFSRIAPRIVAGADGREGRGDGGREARSGAR